METKILFRGFCLASVLLAGSCASNNPDGVHYSMDPIDNHPISVEPDYKSMRLYYAPADAGIQPGDQARFSSFVASYEAHGNGSIAVSAPTGVNSQAMIAFFAQRINDLGVPKDHIVVATHDAPDGDMRVEVNYVSYQARTGACGQDWSENLAVSGDNETWHNLGCAVQRNVAAQIADPRDLIAPQGMDPSNGAHKTLVITNYEAGKATQADKHTTDSGAEQSAPGSDVGR
jgi:pilus assembly protein CpaD